MFENNNYELYLGDCLEVMDKLIKQGIKVDFILTDLPYGTTRSKWDIVIPFNRYIIIKERNKDKILYKDEFMLKKFKEGINIKEAEKEWEENSREGMWDKVNKLIKDNGAIAFFGSEPFSTKLRMSNIENYKYDWKWIKNRPTGFVHANNKPMKKYEDIIMFSNGVVNHKSKSKNNRMEYNPIGVRDGENKIILPTRHGNLLQNYSNQIGKEYKSKTGYPNDILEFNGVKKKDRVHPTQKPIDLLEYLIKTYTLENEIILDFTMGSGSTGVACLNTNRKFIGIELDGKYFNIAKERIEGID